jgi:hypothetical protein
MAVEAITIFSHKIDPDGVLRVVQATAPKIRETQEGGTWGKAVAEFPRGFLRKKLSLILTHDPDYYQGDRWPQQHSGMLGYFARFPMDEKRRSQVMSTIESFRFCIGTVADPDLDLSTSDPRLDLLSAIASEIDGCLFVPSGLLDARGRVLIDADGSFDPEAVFPWRPEPEVADEDEWDEPDPPDALRVARRALVLAAVAARGVFEMHNRQGHTETATTVPLIREWVQDLGLRDECESIEWERIITPIGEMREQEMIDSVWRLEGLAVLAWALDLFELPRYDTLVDVDKLLSAVGFLHEKAGTILASPKLRDQEQIDGLAEQLLAYHWRMRDFSLRPIAIDFRDFGENCWFGPISVDWAEIVDGDLALEGAPIVSAPDDTLGRCSSCAMERHLAINWLRGWSETYSDTDTST